MKHRIIYAVLAALLSVGAASAPVLAQQEEAANAEHYSVESSLIGTLLDDPAAAAILERLVPNVYASDMFRTMGRPNTLRTASQYEADLTEAKLAEIQAAFDALAMQEPAEG